MICKKKIFYLDLSLELWNFLRQCQCICQPVPKIRFLAIHFILFPGNFYISHYFNTLSIKSIFQADFIIFLFKIMKTLIDDFGKIIHRSSLILIFLKNKQKSPKKKIFSRILQHLGTKKLVLIL